MHIADGGRDVLAVSSLDAIGELEHGPASTRTRDCRRHARRNRARRGRCRDSASSSSNCSAAAGTLEGQSARTAGRRAPPRSARCDRAGARPSPSHSKPNCLEGAQDAVGRPRNLAGPIQILDAQQPAAAVRARVQEARRRRVQRAQVQIARRRRARTGRRRPRRSGVSGIGRRGRRTAFRGARAAPGLRPTSVATGRASRRLMPISSPVSRQ